EGRLLGVSVLYAREPLSPDLTADLGPLAEAVAQYLDRKRSETATRLEAERFRLLTETIPQLVWNADALGRVTYVNTRWTQYTGLSAADLAAGGWVGAVHPDDAADLAAAWRRAL